MSDSDTIKIPFSCPSLNKSEQDAVISVLKSGWLTTGKQTISFEKEFSKYVTMPKVNKARVQAGLSTDSVISTAVNSNTSGMTLALEAFGIKKGSAIITTPYTFVSTAACPYDLGAEVLFADIQKEDYNIDPEKIENLLKNDKQHKIKAIIPVHIGGNICNMNDICFLAQKYDVKVIEDAAHSFPSQTKLGYAGTIGDAGVYSFYANKTITTGEGGMVCTRDPSITHRMEIMRMHGMDRTTWDRYTSPRASWEYDIIAAGHKYNLPDILSAIGREQLKKAESFYNNRKKIASTYNEAFKNFDFLHTPPSSEGNSWHLYMIQLIPNKLKCTRKEFAQTLQERGIGISVHYIPLFHFTFWKKLDSNFTAENFPEAEKKYNTSISLPIWPGMTDDMIATVIKEIRSIGEIYHV